MTKNFWQKDRQSLFRTLLKQYKEEGYDIKEASIEDGGSGAFYIFLKKN